MSVSPELVSDVELVARFPRVLSLYTLRAWRRQGAGPPFYRVGVRVFYAPAEVAAWLVSHREAGR